MENCHKVSGEKQEQSVQSNEIITETKLSILQLFTKRFSPNQIVDRSPNQTTCEICLNTFSADKSIEDQLMCRINKDVVGVVLQSLLVPISSQSNKMLDSVPLFACNQCDKLLTNLVNIFLKLEDLRKIFESVRLKLAETIIMKSTKKTEKHFLCWKKEVQKVKRIYPSQVQLKEIKETEQIDPVENASLSFAEAKYAAIKEKYKRIYKSDLKLTEVSSFIC